MRYELVLKLDESENFQMVLEKVKWMYIYHKPCEIMQKINKGGFRQQTIGKKKSCQKTGALFITINVNVNPQKKM